MTVDLHNKYTPMMIKAIGISCSIDNEITLSHKELMELLDYVFEEGKEAGMDSGFSAGLNFGNPGV